MMLKVVHSFPTWLPQTQTWMYNQINQLNRFGVEPHVVCHYTKNLDQFSVDNIHSLENESISRKVWEKGLRVLRVRRHLQYLVDISRKTNSKIVHSHFGNVGWDNLGAIRKLNVKHVVTFYGFDVNKLPVESLVWRERYHELFNDVDLILCEGSHMARCILELGCPERKVKVQHLGADVDNIRFQPRQWNKGEPIRVLIAATFREKKGIVYAIKALKIIKRKVPVQLTIIGDAGQDSESKREKTLILAALESSGLKEQTRLLGYQAHNVLLQEAYDHHLFLQPSITAKNGDTEGGAPVSIIEMMATGMPVVSTTHCDIPEVVGPGLSHLLASERDVKMLAECIRSLLDKPSEWLGIAQAGRKRVENEFHCLCQAQQLSEHYGNILDCR